MRQLELLDTRTLSLLTALTDTADFAKTMEDQGREEYEAIQLTLERFILVLAELSADGTYDRQAEHNNRNSMLTELRNSPSYHRSGAEEFIG